MSNSPSGGAEAGRATEQSSYYLSSTANQRLMAERTAHEAARFVLPHLRPGMNLIDCGCGPGSITIGLAKLVAPGHVTGVDISDLDIEHAKVLAAEQGVTNVTFQTASVYTLPFPDNTFDAVFSNAMMEHLAEPLDALREMRRVLKPDGVAGIRAAEQDGYISYPPGEPLILRYRELVDAMRTGKSTARIGKQLRKLLREAGFARVEASASYDSFGTPEKIRAWGEAFAATIISPARVEKWTQAGVTTQAELEEIAAAFRRRAVDPDAFFAQARCEAVGWKE